MSDDRRYGDPTRTPGLDALRLICGDGPDGPSYTLRDGTRVLVPLDGEPIAICRSSGEPEDECWHCFFLENSYPGRLHWKD